MVDSENDGNYLFGGKKIGQVFQSIQNRENCFENAFAYLRATLLVVFTANCTFLSE